MAVKYYYKSGGGNDNFGTAANWYTGSGGTGVAAGAPGNGDDAIIDADSNVTILTIAATASVKSLYVADGFLGTLAGTSSLTLNGIDVNSISLYFGVDFNLTYSGTITFAGANLSSNVQTNARTIQGNVTINGSLSSWIFDHLITLTTSTLTLSLGSISIYGSASIGLFVSTGISVRELTGNGQDLFITGVGTVWNVTGSSCTIGNFVSQIFNNVTSSAKTITQTISAASASNLNGFYLYGGNGSVTITGNFYLFYISNTGGGTISFGICNFFILSFTNSTVVLNSPTNVLTFNTDAGLLEFSPNMTITASPPITISNTGGGPITITCNGKTLTGNITITGVNAVLYTSDIFLLSGTLTLNSGNFTASYTSYIGNVSTSSSTSRTFNVIDLYLTGSGTLITATTSTNLSWSTNSIYVWGGQVASRTLSFNTVVYPSNGYCELGGTGSGAITLAVATTGDPRVYVTNTGGATVSFTTGNMAELIFSGGTNVVLSNAASQTLTIDGDLTLVSTMGTPTLTPSFIFRGAGWALGNNSRITLAGKSLVTGTVTLNDSSWSAGSGTFTFLDAFSSNAAVTITSCASTNINVNFNLTLVTNTLTLTAGTLNVNNGANITCGLFSSSNSNTRVLNMGSGTWTLTGTGTIWNLATSAGMTLNAQQSRIVMTNTSATACTFAGGGLTYYTVEFAKGSSTAIITISGSNTFANFIDNTSTAAHTITLAASTTQSFYKFNVRGSTGGLITINRSAAPTPILTKLGKGIVCYSDYITLGTLTGTPASTWYIGASGSIGTSTGFIATAAPSSQSLLGAGGVG